MLVSKLFIISTILELVYVLRLKRSFEQSRNLDEKSKAKGRRMTSDELLQLIYRIDIRSCILSKTMYIVFNIIYWAYYLSK